MQLSTKDKQILTTLLQEGKTGFNELQKKTKISPATLQGHLTQLIKKKHVKMDGKGWKRGKKRWYQITPTGEQHVTQIALEDVSSSVKILAGLVEALASNPEKIDELRTALDAPGAILDRARKEDPGISPDELGAIFDRETKKVLGPIQDSLVNLYQLYWKIRISLSHHQKHFREGFVMGVSPRNKPYFIPVAILKKHGIKGLKYPSA